MTEELQVQVQRLRTRFLQIDKEFSKELAFKKKQDIRKLIHSGTNSLKKEAVEIVWNEVNK